MSNSYFSLLRITWRYAAKERPKYLLIYFLFILSSAGMTINPLLYGWFVNALQQNNSEILASVWIYVAGYLGLQLFVSLIHGPTRVMERKLAFNISRNFLDELFQKLLHLPVDWHKDHHSGATVNRLKKAYGSLKRFFQHGFFYFYTFVQFIFSFAAMLYFSPIFGGIALLLGIALLWVVFKFDKPFTRSLKEVNEKEHILSASLTDSLVNILTVITLRLEKRMQIDLLTKFKEMLEPFRKNIVVNEWRWFSGNMLIYLIYVVMVVGYTYTNYSPGEPFRLGGLVALLGFVTQFTTSFSRINVMYTEIVEFNTDVQTVAVIETATPYKKHPHTRLTPIPQAWKHILIDGLNFRYKHVVLEKMTPGLYDLKLQIKRGDRIALIGESGSGKSTLLTLLRGLYSSHAGLKLTVDDDSFYDWESFWDTVTLFPQEPEIFESTILHNVTLGLPFDEDEVKEACNMVFFTDVVNHMPNGLQTYIQEKGANLSGGQKQRLALARGVLAARNSSIILLDEPTSAIDAQTEIQIYKRFFEEFRDKTIISSLHNLHLLNLFDYVYVLHEGRIVEEGTFEEVTSGDYLKSTMFAVL